MVNNDSIFGKIAEALLVDYTSVYYVNAVTNEYHWYSCDQKYHSLHLEQGGKDFFTDLVRDADRVIHEDDKHLFIQDMQKENLLRQMKKGTMQSIEYRLMIDGKPVYHTVRLIRGVSDDNDCNDDDYFILGIINVDEQVRRRIENERIEKERIIYNEIAGSLASHYDTIYYIDADTGRYFEFSSTDRYKSFHIPETGDDFFTESRRNIPRIIYPDDQQRVLSFHYKEVMLKALENNKVYTMTYRIVISGMVSYCRYVEMWASDKKHIIVCLENISDEVETQRELEESKKRSIVYAQITESLISHYDVIYYVDITSGEYMEFKANPIYGDLVLYENGEDFFTDAQKNGDILLHPDDKEKVKRVTGRDFLSAVMETKKQYICNYRLIVNGNTQYTRLTITCSNDRVHIVIGVENTDEEVRRAQEQAEALKTANELARRDGLTGVRNKTAYHEFESRLQHTIDTDPHSLSFAIVLCDINDLKAINDSLGHNAGDDYIRKACRLICDIFAHSPVFRVGGDEFAAILSGRDLHDMDDLFDRLRKEVLGNLESGGGAVVASGIAVYDDTSDSTVSEVFERADRMMYNNKRSLKSHPPVLRAISPENADNADKEIIPEAPDNSIPKKRRERLDNLFNALSVISEGTYVYLCDMRYDYSRWSKDAVDTFGLPSEYMYSAGSIWDEHIHPEDKEMYRQEIGNIFAGSIADHDMQYRARRKDGQYDRCTCRGVILRDSEGNPEYFCGSIKNHNIQSNVDTLTGLHNQYGLFEDMRMHILKQDMIHLAMVGISRFSDINEIYGYEFGNLILQKFGRYIFEHVGNTGTVYHLDGTKFVILTGTRTIEQMKERYEDLRTYFRQDFTVDGKHIILDVNCGMITVDKFNIDYHTAYACLCYTYGESKVHYHGDPVVFYDDLNNSNRQRLEKLHSIRASILQEYNGFFLVYQPVVDAQSEKLIGAEALLRWKSDEYGLVPPDHFIPLLERDPLFCDLGEWILRTAIFDAKVITRSFPDFVIHVNLSYTQLEKPGFVEMVKNALKEFGLDPRHLCLEITERCRLLDMELLKNVTASLRGNGIAIALDDFGTGFSSVGVIKDLPIDTIKIDRSFVIGIEEDEKERDLIKSFADVASTFGAKVCVEGIESPEMRDILRHYSIHSFQGYYYSKPLRFEDFIEWKNKRFTGGSSDMISSI